MTFLLYIKPSGQDRTAAERNYVAESNPPQAENPAKQDSILLFLVLAGRAVVPFPEISGKMLHIGEAAHAGSLLNLQGFVGQQCVGLFHSCL